MRRLADIVRQETVQKSYPSHQPHKHDQIKPSSSSRRSYILWLWRLPKAKESKPTANHLGRWALRLHWDWRLVGDMHALSEEPWVKIRTIIDNDWMF